MKDSKMFFFEKKNQKTFAPLRACLAPAGATRVNNVFFAAIMRPDDGGVLAAPSEAGRLFGLKKQVFLPSLSIQA